MTRLRKWPIALVATALVVVGTGALPAAADPYGTQGGPLSLSSSSPSRGSQVSVSGAGFAPASTVTLTLHSAPVSLGTATVDATGAFSATVQIPVSAAGGDHQIVATGQAAGGGVLTLTSSLVIAGGGSSGGSIPFTGTKALPMTLAGIILVVVGSMAVMTVRRRHSAE